MFTLRDYQTASVDACFAAWRNHGSLLLELPTGTGKTVCFAEIGSRWGREPGTDGRVMVVCPAIELIDQARHKFCKATGIMPDVEQADNFSNESEWGQNPFVVASKQTLCRKGKNGRRFERFKGFGLVIVDEAHLSLTEEYSELLCHFRSQGAKVLGVTATPKRHDKRAMGQLYEHLAYQYGIVDAIKDGWLVSPITHCVQLKTLDLSGVGTSNTQYGKDFNTKQLNDKLEANETVLEIAEVTAAEVGKDKTVVYCSSVEEARLVSERLADCHKLKSDWVCSDEQRCTKQRRMDVLRSFTKEPDGVQIVCNVGILTTGWDFPGLEHIVMARPTRSTSLYTQIMGRGTRPLDGVVDFPGSTPELRLAAIAASAKPHFKVTDLVDASMEHKIVTCMDVLGGKWTLAAIERAKKDAEAGGPVDAMKAIEEAEKKLREEAEEAERKMRAQIQARAEYTKIKADPFDAYSAGSGIRKGRDIVMPFGKYKGKPIASLPTGYIKYALATWQLKGYLQQAMSHELVNRSRNYTPNVGSLDEINNLFMEARHAGT